MNILSNDEITEYGRMISILSKRMITNKDVAEEAAQEVWVEVLKSLSSFREESKLSTWIYTIAKRVISKYAINERLHSTEFLHCFITGDSRELPEQLDMDKELWIKEECDLCLTGLFHCLSNEARMIYIFRDIIELSYSEISEIMGKDEAALRKTLSRSRVKLRNFLNKDCRIFNPSSQCKCRMNTLLEEIDLPGEYQRIREMGKHISIFRQAEKVLPTRNYWENIGFDVTKSAPPSTNLMKTFKGGLFMSEDQKLKTLQMYYAAALADSTLRYGKAGILDEVTAQKRMEQMKNGAALADRFRVKEPQDAFLKTADTYGCADWGCEKKNDGFVAIASRCMLCTISKKMGEYSPCKIHCLSPMEAMLRGIAPEAEFVVEETLWESDKCKVNVVIRGV